MADCTVSVAGTDKSVVVAIGNPLSDSLKELLSKKQRKQAVAFRVNGELYDLSTPVERDMEVEFVLGDSPDGLDIIRHSTAHLLAHAVVDLFGAEVKVAIGPSTDDGFYYDFDRSEAFNPDDLEKIETRMLQLAGGVHPFVRETVTIAEARRIFAEKQQGYKLEILDEIEDDTVSLYKVGEFVDLCRGPHVPHSGLLQVYKLTRLAGAYWRGDENRTMLQRIYGTAFSSPKDLKKYLLMLEEAKKRDHRKLGRELGLFTMQDQIGPGLVLWQPKGALMRKLIEDQWREEHYRHDYELLYTPHIAKRDLWQTSGHLDFYGENMYAPMDIDEVSYQLKPMNCPFHIAIYNTGKRSYREFPIRWCELGTVYRYEKTGALHGLMRVRGFTQDDAHIFCLPEQLEEEIYNILDLNMRVLRLFGFDQYDIYLSTRPEKSVGSDENWARSTEALKMALDKKGFAYEMDPGEGVFYGPKIDIKIKDKLGRSWQCSTIQVDFNLPERFKLSYTGTDGKEHQPIMIHRALMGSLERFFGVMIEHYAGAFPVWLAPVQARLMNITDAQLDYTNKVYAELRQLGVRVEKDTRNEKLNYKIREAQLQKIPYMLIVGDKEMAESEVTIRLRDGENLPAMKIADFAEMVQRQCSEEKALAD
ncbi:MAG: threonine--tRNA ligase [Desulfobulbaceae bacterium]|nr:threonine--tRNA ligase [Desulfobulbaceae bacterium]